MSLFCIMFDLMQGSICFSLVQLMGFAYWGSFLRDALEEFKYVDG